MLSVKLMCENEIPSDRYCWTEREREREKMEFFVYVICVCISVSMPENRLSYTEKKM